MENVAIIGAGMTGLTLARFLQPHVNIELFDKGRGVGGRMSTRYGGGTQFDHGTQFFTARSKPFIHWLRQWVIADVITPWFGRFAEIENGQINYTATWSSNYPHYVATPSMNMLPKAMAQGFNIKLKHTIASIKHDKHWVVVDQYGHTHGPYDWIIVTAPPQQTADLIPSSACFFHRIQSYVMQACYSLMLHYHGMLDLPFDAALLRGYDLSWCSVNSTKPGRTMPYRLVFHATNAWSTDHLELDNEAVIDHLIQSATRHLGPAIGAFRYVDLQRWRYANIPKQPNSPPMIDHKLQLGVCGDWLIQGRIEAAFLSALQFATAFLGRMGQTPCL